MFTNRKPSEGTALLDKIDPVSQAAATVTTGWMSMATYMAMMAVISTGVLGASATVDAKLQQATDNTGTGVKDITGKAITQIVKATGDSKIALINLRAEEMDVANGFAFVRLSLTVGTAASLVAAQLYGFLPSYAPATQAAAVVQTV